MNVIIVIIILLLIGASQVTDSVSLARIYAAYKNEIDTASMRFNVPRSRIIAIIAQESSGNPEATGAAGERGMMQMTQGALADYDRVYGRNWSFDDMYNAAINIEAGTGFLSWLRTRLDGDLDQATRAYNAGLGNVATDPQAGAMYLASVRSYESQISIT